MWLLIKVHGTCPAFLGLGLDEFQGFDLWLSMLDSWGLGLRVLGHLESAVQAVHPNPQSIIVALTYTEASCHAVTVATTNSSLNFDSRKPHFRHLVSFNHVSAM